MLPAPVAAILRELLSGARAVLGEQFVGLYLYGSLASGDFNPATSDIDFVIVTEGALPPETVAGLEALHQRLWAAGSYWAAHLEGTYIPRAAWRRYDPAMPPVPSVNEGRFYVGGHGSDWLIQRQVVRAGGVALAGPPAASLIDPVTPDELRAAVAGIVRGWWGPVVLADPDFLRRADYQAFAVLTMCRALYGLEHGAIVSKPAAARWASAALPERWRSLIEAAAAWGHDEETCPPERSGVGTRPPERSGAGTRPPERSGVGVGRVEEIRAFIRFTVEQVDTDRRYNDAKPSSKTGQ